MDVTLIPGFNPGPYTGDGNNTYLLCGHQPTLIDAATGESRHLDAVAERLAGAPLRRVVVTHAHSDHVSGCEAIARRWPGVEFVKMPWPERDARHAVEWTFVADGDRIPAGDTMLRVVHTPGHAPDHVCLYEEQHGTLFCADLLIKGRTVVIPASYGGDLKTYLASLRLIETLAPVRVLPAHGPEIDDLGSLVQEYVDHRRRREAEILAALGGAPQTSAMLVDQIYTDLPKDLRQPAGESVLAHLLKLREEGQVRERDGAWELRPPTRQC